MPQRIKTRRSNAITLPTTANLSAGELGYTEVAGVKRLFIGNYAGTGVVEIGGDNFALLNSPAFIGTPTAPTATAGTNTTQIATTSFVANAVSSISGVDSKIYRFAFTKTQNFTISSNSQFNLFSVINQTDITNGTRTNFSAFTQDFTYNATNQSLNFPAFSSYAIYNIRLILNATFGTTNAVRSYYVQLNRGVDNSLVSSFIVLKADSNNLSGVTTVLLTFTNTLSDPYISPNGGVRAVINNTSNVDMDVVSFSVLIAGQVTNFT